MHVSKNLPNLKLITSILLLLIFVACKEDVSKTDYNSWRTYAGSKDGIRYSSNTHINRNNVASLKVAWTYSSHDRDTGNRSQNQCNPIVVDGILYGTSPALKLFALDAATGLQKWLFDPATVDTAKTARMSFYKVSRGVTYWENEEKKEKRLFYSVGSRTYAIDAVNGLPIQNFGNAGWIDLADDLDREKNFNPFVAGTTPGIIYKKLLITGMRVAESADAAPGHIRAYDVITGRRKWIFHTIPQPGEKGHETWEDKNAYDHKAQYLAEAFLKNFEKFAALADADILAGAPKLKADA